MKKFLSLVLALVMTMSLVTISAGAKDFTDADKVNYDEAIAVISEIGVVDGYTDGTFKPQATLTRGAAAKIICNLILGPTTAAELSADTAPFKDVPVDNTFAGYIAYCAKEGIISGYADGTFRPAGTLTGYAFMKMLLGALGYDASVEGYTGANWSINVAKQAIGIGLNKSLVGEFDGTKPVTREEACLYAFNTLKATLVSYDNKTVVSVGGAEVTVGGSVAKPVTWKEGRNYDGNIKDDDFVQFAEEYFSKLVRDTDDTDDFGRPVNKWSYNKKDIGSFVNHDLLAVSYTAKVEGGDIYTDIGSTACKFDLTYWVDGEKLDKADTATEAAKLAKKNDTKMNSTGKGVLTEVYTDIDKDETTIVVINTWLAEVAADYSEKTESVRLNVFDNTLAGPTTHTTSYTVELDDVPGIEDLKEDDMVLVNIADGDVVIISDVETVEDVEITSYSTDYDDAAAYTTNKLTKLTADGEKYETAAKAFEDAEVLYDYKVEALKDTTYDLFLDPYGYVIGARKVTADDQYVFVAGYERSSSYLAKAIDKALVIFTDGTMETVNMKSGDLAGGRLTSNETVDTWYTYTEKDGVYNLEEVVANQIKDKATTLLDRENVSVVDSTVATKIAHGNNKSVFITVDVDDDVIGTGSIVDVDDVYTGIKNTKIEVTADADLTGLTTYISNEKIFAFYDKNSYITYAVVVGQGAGNNNKMVYLTSDIKSKELDNGDYIWTYEALSKDGPITLKSLVAKDNSSPAAWLAAEKLYKATSNADGYVTKMTKMDPSATLKTATYKDDGYVLTSISGTAQELFATESTFYFDKTDNQKYILLDEDCRFFVYTKDEDEYVEYSNAKSALSALGYDTYFTGTVAAFVNDAGIATTLILKDTYTANDKLINQYTVTVTADAAKVTVSPIASPVNKGANVTFTVTPVEGVTVTGVTANGSELTAAADGVTYTIKNVTKNQAIVVSTTGTPVTRSAVTITRNESARVTIDGALVSGNSVNLTAGEHTLAVEYAASVPAYLQDETFTGTTEVFGSTTYITVDGTTAYTLTVGKDSVALDLDAAVASAAKIGTTTLNDGDKVPVGATVTLTPVATFGSWNSDGSKQFTAATEFTVAADGTVDTSEYGFYKVTISAPASVTFTPAAPITLYLNTGTTKTFTAGSTGDWTGATGLSDVGGKLDINKGTVAADTHSAEFSVTATDALTGDYTVTLKGSWE